MFWHIFRYSLKGDLHDRATVFWTMAFPLILATFFGLAFANLDEIDTFSRIPVAVVDNTVWQQDGQLQNVMRQVSSGEKPLFDLRVLTEADALAALKENRVTGIITARSATAEARAIGSHAPGAAGSPGTPTAQSGISQLTPPATTLDVTVARSGLAPSIIKVFADEYLQTAAGWRNVMTLDPGIDMGALQRAASQTWLTRWPLVQSSPDTTLTYFYALIAMTCLYGGFWGMKEVMQVQANQSTQATRVVVSPASRLQLVLASSAAKLLIHFSTLLVLIAYLTFGQGVRFGNDLGRVLLAAFLGSLLGIAIGATVGAAFNIAEGGKTGILIGVSMICSMLAGLNNPDIKYIAIKNLPILAWINPANLIGDAFYALYYYETDTRYWGNILAMAAFIVVCGAFVTLKLRRQRYASL